MIGLPLRHKVSAGLSVLKRPTVLTAHGNCAKMTTPIAAIE